MATTDAPAYRGTDRLFVPEFNLRLPCVIVGKNTVYFPIRHVCMALGIGSNRQLERLAHDGRFNGDGDIETLPIITKRGSRPTECIRRDKVATWFTLINPRRVGKPDVRDRLEQFQAAIFAAADRFLWGDKSAVAPADDSPNARPAVVEGTLTITGVCPHCGGRLCITSSLQGTHITPLPSDDMADSEA